MKKLLIIATIIFTIWMAFSYMEILAKNTYPNPEYSKHNLIIKIME